MNTPGERILYFIDSKGFGENRKGKSMRAFYALVDIPNGSFKADRAVGSDNLSKVFDKYPELNMDWVITGRGKMLLESAAESAIAVEKNNYGLNLIDKTTTELTMIALINLTDAHRQLSESNNTLANNNKELIELVRTNSK